MPYTYSGAGLALTKKFEGCRLTAYQDVAGVWTIGWGHTGPEVRAGLSWTQERADQQLDLDLARFVGRVNSVLRAVVTQGQFDALVDFAFNVGWENLAHSTLLRKLNSGDFGGAAAEFLKWDHAGGKEVEGLLLRRQAEQRLFAGTKKA